MKKTLLIFSLLAFAIVAKSQNTTIMKIDGVVIEEFKSVDENGTDITSYRRLTNKQVRDYIEKIKQENDWKAERLERYKDEKQMYQSMIKDVNERIEKTQAEIQDNKRRIEEYRNILNR